MIIYLDYDYKCHVADNGNMVAYETDAFEGKSDSFIEGYRLVPDGEVWVREDGEVFTGLMISPWKDYTELERAQLQYEIEQLKTQNAEYEAVLTEIEQALGV